MTEAELRMDSLMLSDKELALTASSLEEALVDGGYLHTTTYPDGDYLVTRGVRMGTLDEKAKFSCEEVCTFRYRDSSKIEKELRELIAFTASSPGGTIALRLPAGAELLSSNHHRSAVIKNRLNLYWDYRVSANQEMLEMNVKVVFRDGKS